MGRQHPPEADAKSRRGGRGEPSQHPRSGSPEPGSGTTPASGEERPRRERSGAHARGAASALLTWLAGGSQLLSPGRGAHTTCCLSRAEHPQPKPVLPSSPLSLTARRRARLGRGSGGCLRRLSGSTGCTATSGARAAHVSRGGSAEGCGRAGRRARTQMHRPLFGRRGTHRLLPPLPGPPLFLVPSPRAQRTQSRQTGVAARLARRSGRAGRGGVHPAVRWGPSPPTPHPRRRTSLPGSPSREPPPASFERESGGGRPTEK